MTTTLPRLATRVNESWDPRVLDTLAMEGVALAVWHRPPSPALRSWLDALPVDRLPRMRRVIPATQARLAVAAACERAGTPAGRHRDELLDQVAEMVGVAGQVLAAPLVELRLDVTEGQACPRWHLDAVRARLLCTLRGPGTEFGPARPDGAAAAVYSVPTAAAGLFRGLLWPGPELSGVVHRSPPANGEARLLLVVDPLDDAGSC